MQIKDTLLSIAIGKEWKTFIGKSQENLDVSVKETLEELGWEYDRDARSPSTGERFVFGSEGTTTYHTEDPELTIHCTSVTFDPVQRVVFTIGVSRDTREKYKQAVSMIRIKPVTTDTRGEIQAFVRHLARMDEEKPWRIIHPRFNYSPLLRYKVKLLWKYWLNGTAQSRES